MTAQRASKPARRDNKNKERYAGMHFFAESRVDRWRCSVTPSHDALLFYAGIQTGGVAQNLQQQQNTNRSHSLFCFENTKQNGTVLPSYYPIYSLSKLCFLDND
jgi:hypothetical protein